MEARLKQARSRCQGPPLQRHWRQPVHRTYPAHHTKPRLDACRPRPGEETCHLKLKNRKLDLDSCDTESLSTSAQPRIPLQGDLFIQTAALHPAQPLQMTPCDFNGRAPAMTPAPTCPNLNCGIKGLGISPPVAPLTPTCGSGQWCDGQCASLS